MPISVKYTLQEAFTLGFILFFHMCGRFDVENVCILVFVVFAKKEQTANLNFLVLSAALKIYLQMSVTALRRPTADGGVWSAIICHSVDAMDTRIWRTPRRWDVGLVPPEHLPLM